MNPTAKELRDEREMYSGSYFHLVTKRAAVVKDRHSGPLYLQGWDMLTMMPMQSVLTFTTCPGHMSALLRHKAAAMRGLFARLATISQTAFSNYILHSLIYGFVFYGYGLNLFDKLKRRSCMWWWRGSMGVEIADALEAAADALAV